MTYVNGGGNSNDSFGFTVKDVSGTPTAAQTFSITVNDPGIVTLLTNTGLTVNENATATVTSAELAYSDNGGAFNGPGAANTIYTVTTLPAGGILNLSGSPIALDGTFTQANINAGLLTYVNGGGNSSDAFGFTVQEVERHTHGGADLHHHCSTIPNRDTARQHRPCRQPACDGDVDRHRVSLQRRRRRLQRPWRVGNHLHRDDAAHRGNSEEVRYSLGPQRHLYAGRYQCRQHHLRSGGRHLRHLLQVHRPRQHWHANPVQTFAITVMFNTTTTLTAPATSTGGKSVTFSAQLTAANGVASLAGETVTFEDGSTPLGTESP